MTGELVGMVTQQEKNEMLVLFERKLGIEELAATLESDLLSREKLDAMENKMITELGRINLDMQTWWNRMYEKYKWKSIEGCKWSIDFNTSEVFIAK